MRRSHGLDIFKFFSSLLDIKLRVNDYNHKLTQQMLKIVKQMASKQSQAVSMDIGLISSKTTKLLSKGLLKIDDNGTIYATYTIDSNYGQKNGELVTLSKNEVLLLINGIFRQYLYSNGKKSFRPNDISTIIFYYFENDDDRYRNVRKHAVNAMGDIMKLYDQDRSITPARIVNKDVITSLCNLLNFKMTNKLDGNLSLVVMQILRKCFSINVNYLGLIAQADGLKQLKILRSGNCLMDIQDGDITRQDVENCAKDLLQRIFEIKLKINIRRLMRMSDLRVVTPRMLRKRFVFDG